MNLADYKNLSLSRKLAYSFFLTAIAVFLMLYGLLFPVARQIKELKQSIITQNLDLEKKMAQEKNMVKLSEKLQVIEPQLEILESAYINENRKLEFITSLEGIAQSLQLNQQLSLGAEKSSVEARHKKIPVAIEVSGRLPDIVLFLSELERLRYYVNIDSLELSAAGAGADGTASRYNARISAASYWQ